MYCYLKLTKSNDYSETCILAINTILSINTMVDCSLYSTDDQVTLHVIHNMRYLLRAECYATQLLISIFGPLYAGKGAWPPHRLLRVWGRKIRPKSWPTKGSLWVTCYRKIVFPTFLTLEPPLKRNKDGVRSPHT